MMSPIRISVFTALSVFAMTIGIASADAAERVYIPLGSAGKVLIIDPQKRSVIGEIKGLPAVHGLAATPDGRFLVAGSYSERGSGSGAPKKPAGVTEREHKAHHAERPKGQQVPIPAVSSVSIVDTAKGMVVRRIDVPGAVHHVAISPNGKHAVVTHPNQDAVSVIDLTLQRVVATVGTGVQPNYAVFGAKGERVFVSSSGDGAIVEIDANRWMRLGSIKVGESPEHVVLSRDGQTLFVNNVGDGTVSFIDLNKREVTRTVPIGNTLHGIDLSDDGKSLFVAVLGDNKVIAIHLKTWALRSLSLSPEPYHLAAMPGRGTIYVSSADKPKLWVIDQKTLKVVGQIGIGGKSHQIVHTKGM